MSQFRKTQIEHARQVLAQPDRQQPRNRRALNERIARHILKSTEAKNVLPMIRLVPAPAPLGGGDAA